MIKYSDPAMTGSRFPRQAGDRYWTEPWVTEALCETAPPPLGGLVWEPAAGRGDMARVLQERLGSGTAVFASDVEIGEYEAGFQYAEMDFLAEDVKAFPLNEWLSVIQPAAIVTNPPYKAATGFVARALSILEGDNSVEYVAMLLRSEFKHAGSRERFFGGCPLYDGEVVLTSRPRWDWWFRDKPEASPRHNYSWFLWANPRRNFEPTQRFHHRRKG